jgi:hypothetical protein
MCVSVGWSAPLPTRHHADTPTRPFAHTHLRPQDLPEMIQTNLRPTLEQLAVGL